MVYGIPDDDLSWEGRTRRNAILAWLEPLPIHVKTLPGLADLVSGSARVDDLREVDIEDLLGRDPIMPKQELLGKCIRGKVVMVTGAGGTIGSELCRQILRLSPKIVVLYEFSEPALYRIERELRRIVQAEGLAAECAWILGLGGATVSRADPQRRSGHRHPSGGHPILHDHS